MIQVLLLQLFWLSFVCVGTGVILLVRRIDRRRNRFAELFRFLRTTHELVGLFILFCLGIVVFVLPVTVGYICTLPLAFFQILYIGLLGASLCLVVWDRVALRALVCERYHRITKRQVFVGVIVAGILAFEYGLGLVTGHLLDNDTPLHLAKLQLMLNTGHLTFTDPFLGYNGLIDLRYSANILGALQALGGSLLGVPATRVWFYSFAFYRLLLQVSMLSVAVVFLPKRAVPRTWLYAIAIALPYFGITYFFDYPELPHCIQLAWMALLLIGLKLLIEQGSSVIFFIAVVLLAATHSIAALVTLVFIGIFGVVLFVAQLLDKKIAIRFVVAIMILAIPIVANRLVPSLGTAGDIRSVLSFGLHYPLVVTRLGPLVVPDIGHMLTDKSIRLPVDLNAVLLLLGLSLYVPLIQRLQRPRLKWIAFWILTLAVLMSFNLFFFSIIGYVYFVRLAKQRSTKLLVLSAILFYVAIAYNPVVLSAIFGRVPIWLLTRFQDFNIFAYVTPLLGLVAAHRFVARYWGVSTKHLGSGLLVLIVLVGYLGYDRLSIHERRFLQLDQSARRINATTYKNVESLRALDAQLRGQVVFTDDVTVQLYMSSATIGTVGFVSNPQASTMENVLLRTACNDALLDHLSLEDLAAAKVTRVVLRTEGRIDPSAQNLASLAEKASYLRLSSVSGVDRVYEVRPPSDVLIASSKRCVIPFRQ